MINLYKNCLMKNFSSVLRYYWFHTQRKDGSNTLTYGFPGETNTMLGGARGVMVIVVGNRHGDTSSNPGPG